MRDSFHQQVLATIRRHRMTQPGDRIGVAVSGGADSVALLLLLEELAGELGVRLVVLHLNHRLRGADADADEAFVAELAARRGLEIIAAREDVAAEAQRQGWNLEDAGRRMRQRFFAEIVSSGRASRVAVGHTADDQAETLLARLLRGTGPTGLAGVYPMIGDVIRPLLEVRRQALRDFLKARGQAWREDTTNLDTSKTRSRIRHVLLPHLEKEFQPAIVPRLAELAALARDDEAFWAALVDDRFRALVEQSETDWKVRTADLITPFPLQAAGAGQVQDALSRRLVRRIYASVKGDLRQLTSSHVEQVMRLAAEPGSGRSLHLPAGVRVARSFDHLVFTRTDTAARPGGVSPASYEYVLDIPFDGEATIDIPEIRRRFSLKVIDWPRSASDTRGSRGALDRECLHPPVVLRNWRPGDAYRPVGRQCVRKVKRLFLEHRIAARERAGWPVLTCKGKLAWVRGLPAAEEFAARRDTRVGLLIREDTL